MHPRPTHPLAALLLLILIALLAAPYPAAAQPPPDPAAATDTADASAEQLEQLRAQLEAAVADALAAAPGGISLLGLDFDGRILTIDLSAGARALADAGRFEELLGPVDAAVNAVLERAGRADQRSIDYMFLIAGEPLAPQAEPVAAPAPPPGGDADLSLINGQRIMINPGHGWYNDGATWRLQRGYWWNIVEDFINLDLAIELRNRLAAVGANVHATRELNKSAGTYPASGKPLWEMGAAAYTRHIGAPASVWSNGATGMGADIMARPNYANWVGANATISIHNNGGRGCGTETWYDTSNGYAAQSAALAQRIQSKIIERVRAQWSAGWCDRGVKGSNGSYGEIRAVNGPAVLIELAFMDTESDNRALQSATFRSIVTQAISDAVTEYFGGAAVSCPAGSFRAEYFANVSLSGSPAFVRCETRINANWGSGGPGGGLANDNFSVRWQGSMSFSAGTYAFVAVADDGVRLSVDGYPLIDAWRDQASTQFRATRGLAAGTHTVKLEYYERGGGAVAQLFWNVNLALFSPAYTTSQQDATFVARNGNDGNGATRWSSRQSWDLGDEWWWTRIGNRQAITEVRITWEAAYAADHCIAWWSDGETVAQLRCYTISAPGRYSYSIGTQSAQFVGVLMRRRPPGMSNYSLWEFGVYRWGGTLSAQGDGGEALVPQELIGAPESVPVPRAVGQHRVYLPTLAR